MMLVGEGLGKSYGARQVLQDFTINCAAGEVVGLVGANGAGKTTLFKILLGLIEADTGSYHIHSQGVKPVGGIIEKPALYTYLNARENLRYFAKIQGAPATNQDLEEHLLRVGLPLDRHDPVRNFSLGMKQRLGIAIALLNNPECIILDEPFSGLDPFGIKSLRELILGLAKERGMAILVSSHIVDELAKSCDRLYVIKDGQCIRSGPTHALLATSTDTFVVGAPHLERSQTLKKRGLVVQGGQVKVEGSMETMAELLEELYGEGIRISYCSPEINMEKLFEPPVL